MTSKAHIEAASRVIEIRREMASQQQVFETMLAEVRAQRDEARSQVVAMRDVIQTFARQAMDVVMAANRLIEGYKS